MEVDLSIVSAILSIDELRSYKTLRHEAGVRRVQRLPDTETNGLTHISTSAPIVLPQIGMKQIKQWILMEELLNQLKLELNVKRASDKGGQHVTTIESAVIINSQFQLGL